MNTVYCSIKRSFRSLAALLALTLLCSWSLNTAQAQVELSDAEWKIGIGEEDWVDADNTMRGGSLNPVTGNLLVVSRTGAPAIYVVDADDGSVTGELDMEGVSGGDFPINLIKVASNGVIYAANLSVPGSNYRLYRWADEDSEPTLAFEGNPNSTRMGDSFGLYEDDDKVVLMASGTGNDAIFTLTRDKQDDTYTDGLIEDIPAGYARGGFASVDGQDQVWINGYGTPLTLVDLESGDVLLKVPETAIPYQTMEVSFAQIGDRSIAALFPTDTEPEGQYVAIYDVTDAENIAKIGRTAQLGDEENLDGVGSIELDADNQMLYVVGTNNAVAKFDITPALEAVTVVLNFNAATVPDTLRAEDYVQVRGDYPPAGMTWGEDSDVLAQNIGGDYWQATITANPGDTIEYKFWTGFSLDDEGATANGGWESSENRLFVVPDDDQTGIIASDLLFYNQIEPFEEKADSIGIHFRVNIGAQVQQGQFDTEEDRVGVRGLPPFSWDETLFFLDKENRVEGTDNIFYSGTFYAAEELLEEEGGFDFKFVTDIDGIGWEDGDDRPVRFGEIADTTLQYGFFSGEKPSPEEVELIEADIEFAVNVNVLSNLGIFDDAIDGVELRGNFNAWGGGDELTFNPTLDRYQITRDYSGGDLVSVGQRYAYKYFILWDESRENEDSPNYIPGLDPGGAGWEEPGTTGGSDRIYFVTDEADQTTYPDDPGYDYFNDLPGASVILQEFIEGEPDTWPITFRIDMTRATEIPEAEERFVPGEDSVFIAFEEQIFAFSQGFGTGPGHVQDASNIERNENYLLEDVGDGIYEITVDAQLPSVNSFGFIIGYGQPNIGEGTITWNGGGFGSGRRYYQFAMPTQVVDFDGILVSYWPAEPDLDVLTWYGGENFNDEGLTVEAAPDYRALLTSSEDARIDTPVTYNLRQNYPNPFNPTTNIEFTIPESHDVRLEVYNILGRRVATLVNTYKNAGTHTVQFDASRLASGMYIYRLQAGDFVQQRQMMLVK